MFSCAILLLWPGMMLSANPAHALDAERCDTSSFENANARPSTCAPRAIADEGVALRVEILRDGEKDFPNPHKSGDEENQCWKWGENSERVYESSCHCREKVEFLHLDRAGSFGGQFNSAERKRAEGFQCSSEFAYVDRVVVSAAANKHFMSAVTRELFYGQGSAGSCHGHYEFSTYDLSTGQSRLLTDMVDETALSRLPEILANDFVQRHGAESSDKNRLKQQVIEALKKNDPKKTGIYVELGKVWLNVDEWIFSCADGNFHPVLLPESILKVDVLKKIHSRKQQKP